MAARSRPAGRAPVTFRAPGVSRLHAPPKDLSLPSPSGRPALGNGSAHHRCLGARRSSDGQASQQRPHEARGAQSPRDRRRIDRVPDARSIGLTRTDPRSSTCADRQPGIGLAGPDITPAVLRRRDRDGRQRHLYGASDRAAVHPLRLGQSVTRGLLGLSRTSGSLHSLTHPDGPHRASCTRRSLSHTDPTRRTPAAHDVRQAHPDAEKRGHFS